MPSTWPSFWHLAIAVREFVLNSASLPAPDIESGSRWLLDIARGMSTLVHRSLVEPRLRTNVRMHELRCAPGITMDQALWDLMRRGEMETYIFMSQLAKLTPIHLELQEEVRDRFLRCEAIGCEPLGMAAIDGELLVLCACSGSVLVSHPFNSMWDRDSLTVVLNELQPDDASVVEVSETVNALSRSSHADAIASRIGSGVLGTIKTFEMLWELRSEAFPHLEFGPDVNGQLNVINQGLVSGIKDKLTALNRDAGRWQTQRRGDIRWSIRVTDESNSVKNDPRLSEARRFASVTGNSEFFFPHARLGNSVRIHLRVDSESRTVEVGYIGKHLPL